MAVSTPASTLPPSPAADRRRSNGGGRGGFRVRLARRDIREQKVRVGGRRQGHADAARRVPGAVGAISIASYRTLFASMAANLAQQVGALSQLSGGRSWVSRSRPHSTSRPPVTPSRPTLARRRPMKRVATTSCRGDSRPRSYARRAGRRADERRSAHDLRSGVADRGVQGLRPGAEVQLRRLERARDADQARRAGRHLRLGCTAQHAAALRGGHRRQAGHVHGEPARVDRAEVEPRRDSSPSTT